MTVSMNKKKLTKKNILSELKKPLSDKLLLVAQALRFGLDIVQIYKSSKVDPWFIGQIKRIVDTEQTLKKGLPHNAKELLRIKSLGFSDKIFFFVSFFLFILTVISSNPSKPVSSDLNAFCNDSGNDLPIAMTSPTDFIELDSKGCVN